MDLSQFEMANDAIFMQLKSPVDASPLFGDDDKPVGKPVGFNVYGFDSPQSKKAQNAARDRAAERQRAAKGKAIPATVVDAEVSAAMMGCVAEFVNVTWNGRDLVAGPDNAFVIEKMPWAIEQLVEFVGDRSNFMKGLAKN